jgi:hypothetical protein
LHTFALLAPGRWWSVPSAGSGYRSSNAVAIASWHALTLCGFGATRYPLPAIHRPAAFPGPDLGCRRSGGFTVAGTQEVLAHGLIPLMAAVLGISQRHWRRHGARRADGVHPYRAKIGNLRRGRSGRRGRGHGRRIRGTARYDDPRCQASDCACSSKSWQSDRAPMGWTSWGGGNARLLTEARSRTVDPPGCDWTSRPVNKIVPQIE